MENTKDFFVHPSSFVDKSVRIGKKTQVWHFCHVREGARIGDNCNIGQNVYIGKDVAIGNDVKVQNNVSVYEKVTLEDSVFCGPSCVFTNVVNPRCEYPRNRDTEFKATHVRHGASIGANATIVCGVEIGRYAFIGAGAVVTKDVPAYALFYGNPATLKGWMCECGEKLLFKEERALCAKCAKRYRKTASTIEKVS
jgi:UDP-2-acetamido-3-amino-2,3-dideoxy-glucuronate N-acetyltransferase